MKFQVASHTKYSIAITIPLTPTVFVFPANGFVETTCRTSTLTNPSKSDVHNVPLQIPHNLGRPSSSQLNPQIRVHWHELHT